MPLHPRFYEAEAVAADTAELDRLIAKMGTSPVDMAAIWTALVAVREQSQLPVRSQLVQVVRMREPLSSQRLDRLGLQFVHVDFWSPSERPRKAYPFLGFSVRMLDEADLPVCTVSPSWEVVETRLDQHVRTVELSPEACRWPDRPNDHLIFVRSLIRHIAQHGRAVDGFSALDEGWFEMAFCAQPEGYDTPVQIDVFFNHLDSVRFWNRYLDRTPEESIP